MKKILLALFILTYSLFNAKAEAKQGQARIDSLRIALKNYNTNRTEQNKTTYDKSDTLKVQMLYNLCKASISISNYTEAKQYADEALNISEQIKFNKGIAHNYNNIGSIYYFQGNFPDALKYYFLALRIYEQLGNKKGISGCYNNIGNIYDDQGNFPDALKSHFASLKIREEMGDKKGLSSSYNNIGIIYWKQGNYKEAIINHNAALKIEKEIGDKLGIAGSYANIGNIYIKQGNYTDALKNYFAALKIREEIGDKKGIANAYGNIGSIYLQQSNYTDALKMQLASLKIKKEIGDKNGIAASCNNLGVINTVLKKYKEAKNYFADGLTMSKETGTIENIQDSYSGLAILDSATSNWKDAYQHHKLYIIYRDSLINEENTKKTVQIQMQYDFDKKVVEAKAEQQKKDAVANQELKIQKLQLDAVKKERVYYIIGIALLIVVVFFIIRSLKVQKKSNLLKQQLAIAADRARISTEMHDDLGSGLSKISLLSDMLTRDTSGADIKPHLENISRSSKEVVEAMGDIIWSMNAKNDVLTNLIAYTRKYAMEYFENTAITCKVIIPQLLPTVNLDGTTRRNIFLVVKEALHNVLKHSTASEVTIQFDVTLNNFGVLIKDNGKGIDLNNLSAFGNGLKNMEKRMKDIGGTFEIKNHEGTAIIISLEVEYSAPLST